MSDMSLKPRGLTLDLFGEYLRFVDGGEVQLGHLITLLGAFDVAPPTVRVTMVRLRKEGWFTVRRNGRESYYRLTNSMLAVLEAGRERIFADPPDPWEGHWTLVIYQLTENERQERDQLRKKLAWNGFGPLSTSTWLAAGDRRATARELFTDLDSKHAEVLQCHSDGLEHDRQLAERCWDLAGLAAEYDEFNAAHLHLVDAADELEGPDALVARTSLISRYRHFLFRDPQLPSELTPEPWPGDQAYNIFHEAHQALGPAARAYVSDIIGHDIIDAETAQQA